jgi:putative ABC transport system permease protein
MKYSYILSLAVKNLLGRKLRTFLTIIGVAISVGFVCLLMAFSYGLQQAATKQIASGDTLKNIDVSNGSSKLVSLDNTAINKIKDFSEVAKVYPQIALAGDTQIGDSKSDGVIYGTNNDLLNIIKPKMVSGKLYNQDASQTIILNTTLASHLTDGALETLIGQTIDIRLVLRNDLFTDKTAVTQIKAIKATVTGITSDGKTSYAFVPLKTITDLGVDRYSALKVQLKSTDDVEKVKSQIEFMEFRVSTVKDTIDQVNQFFQVFQIILVSVGMISVIVATLGIFNTMTISLIEKTREVGLMKILGVKKVYIRRIFMTESLIIGLAGGLIGVISSIAMGQTINYTINAMAVSSGNAAVNIMYFPVLLVLLIMFMSVLISLLAGLYPARRTTRISPLDALRYE